MSCYLKQLQKAIFQISVVQNLHKVLSLESIQIDNWRWSKYADVSDCKTAGIIFWDDGIRPILSLQTGTNEFGKKWFKSNKNVSSTGFFHTTFFAYFFSKLKIAGNAAKILVWKTFNCNSKFQNKSCYIYGEGIFLFFMQLTKYVQEKITTPCILSMDV